VSFGIRVRGIAEGHRVTMDEHGSCQVLPFAFVRAILRLALLGIGWNNAKKNTFGGVLYNRCALGPQPQGKKWRLRIARGSKFASIIAVC